MYSSFYEVSHQVLKYNIMEVISRSLGGIMELRGGAPRFYNATKAPFLHGITGLYACLPAHDALLLAKVTNRIQ